MFNRAFIAKNFKIYYKLGGPPRKVVSDPP